MVESESAEMYLKTIFELEAGDEPVAISHVAERWGVSVASANEMVKRLVERQLVNHIPYKGVTLTDQGRRRAIEVLRRHRLWERFLVDQLGIPWERAHDPACRMEHVTSDEVVEKLAEFLQQPETCPHGNAIPTAEGVLKEAPAIPLSEMSVGQSGRIARINREETILLTYLAEQEVYPDLPVCVEDIAPYNGPLTVRVGEQNRTLGREVAAHVLVDVAGSS